MLKLKFVIFRLNNGVCVYILYYVGDNVEGWISGWDYYWYGCGCNFNMDVFMGSRIGWMMNMWMEY